MKSSTDDHASAVLLARRATELSLQPRRLIESSEDPLDVIDAISRAQTSLRMLKRRLVIDDCRRSLANPRATPADRLSDLSRTLSRGLRR
jgi:hypothetical protein